MEQNKPFVVVVYDTEEDRLDNNGNYVVLRISTYEEVLTITRTMLNNHKPVVISRSETDEGDLK